MKKKFKILGMMSLLFLLSGNVFASLFLGGKYMNGVGNICYYVDSSANSYVTWINNAANNWEVTGFGWNPIYMTAVSSNNWTQMDIYLRNSDDLGEGVLGQTSFYDTSEVMISPYSNDWYFTIIEINGESLGNHTDEVKQGTIAHEMGHSFGLAHQNQNMYSIMCQKGAGRRINTVDEVSHNAINHIYN